MELRCKQPMPTTSARAFRVPAQDDWARLYPEIRYMYIQKRYKLRHIIQHIEQAHGLKATEQMYKKRLCQWKLLKKASRPPKDSQSSIISPSPRFSKQHRLNLTILESVKTWNNSFFETCNSQKPNLFPDNGRPAIVTDFVLALKLASSLLARGRGHLAGRVTRKAFLMLEETTVLHGPATAWNLLEILHYQITLGQEKLCQMLLAHLPTLISRKTATSHPLFRMLHSIRELLTISESTGLESHSLSSSSPLSSASPSSSTDTSTEYDSPRVNQSYALLDTLKQSWSMNAQMIFERLDVQFFALYCNIDWDLCTLRLSSAEINTAHLWFGSIDKQGEHYPFVNCPTRIECNDDSESDGFGSSPDPSMSHAGDDLPEDFEKLRATSIAALRRDLEAIMQQRNDSDQTRIMISRILAVLVTSNVLPWPMNMHSLEAASIGTSELLRLHAGHIANAMRTLLDLDRDVCTEHDGNGNGIDIVKTIQSIIAFREYAFGETDLRVAQDLWALHDAFIQTGDVQSALRTEIDAIQRLDKYVRA